MRGSAQTSAQQRETARAEEPSARAHRSDRRSARGWSDLWILIGSSAYLYLNLFTLRGTPFLLTGDQVFYWMDVERMMAGERIYRDFFKFTPPGTDLLYFVSFKLLGLHIWVPNLIVFALGIALTWICFRIASLFLDKFPALLAASFFLVFIYGALLNATHHSFSELGVLAAVAVLMQGRNEARLILAGVLLGAAMFFTQTRAPAAYLGFCAFFIWERWRTQSPWQTCLKRLGLLLVALLFAWACLSGYFIATTGLRELLYWQLVYSFRYKVTGAGGLGLPVDSFAWYKFSLQTQALLVYLLLPVVYAFSLWNCWNEPGGSPPLGTTRRMILTFVGLATTIEVAQSPNWLRVYCVAAPAILLLIWMASSTGKLKRILLGLMWIGLICVAGRQTWARHQQTTIATLPAGKVATAQQAAEKLEWIGQRTEPGDFIFEPAWPGVYLPLHLLSPVYAEGFAPSEETRPEFVVDAIQKLEARQVRYILWSPRLDSPAHPEADHLGPFRRFMRERYRQVWVFPDRDQVWEHK
jgi:hypothetical protein